VEGSSTHAADWINAVFCYFAQSNTKTVKGIGV